MSKIFCLLIGFVLLLPLNVFAQPSIDSISGSLAEGASVTIAGSNFGSKSPIAPSGFLKDDIENGTDGNEFSDPTGWTHSSDTSTYRAPRYSTTQAHSGTKSLLFHFYDEYYGCRVTYDHGSTFTEFYLTAWIYLDKDDTRTGFQWKNWRVKDDSDYSVETGVIGDNWWSSELNWMGNNDVQCRCAGEGTGSKQSMLYQDAFLFDNWQRIEAYYKKSDTDTSNGTIIWRRIGTSLGEKIINMDESALTHKTACATDLWQYLYLGHYYGNLSGGSGRDFKAYYDDIYIDTTRARVEIGNSATWANCTHREIQIPTAWSNNSITITVNQGSFAPCEQLYLFVVDVNGNVNTQGYPVQFPTIAGKPCPPTDLKVLSVQ